MLKRSVLFILFAIIPFQSPSNAASRRPPVVGMEEVKDPDDIAPSYLPHVEKLPDRYRLTIQSPEPLPHYLIEKSAKKIWLRLVKPSVDSTQILEGDTVIHEVK